jgi:hypothetical protein
MSAMFVSKCDIDLLVSARRVFASAVRIGERYDRADRVNPDDLGRLLWAENVRSLRHRYPTDRDDHRAFDREVLAYAFTAYRDLKPGLIGRLAEFYEYQTCEHPDWRASDAFFALGELRVELVKLLPGADDAPWGVAEDSDIASFARTAAPSRSNVVAFLRPDP